MIQRKISCFFDDLLTDGHVWLFISYRGIGVKLRLLHNHFSRFKYKRFQTSVQPQTTIYHVQIHWSGGVINREIGSSLCGYLAVQASLFFILRLVHIKSADGG